MNADARIFAIGDIHGCQRQLATLLERIPLDKKRDTLVFLGDYINRGPDSRHVLETLLRVREECANTVFLMGNHEEMLLEYAATGDIDRLRLLHAMGVEATLASYNASMRDLRNLSFLPETHREFLHSLRLSWVHAPYLFVHADAGPQPGDPEYPRKERIRTADQVLASRRLAREAPLDTSHVMIFGHTPFEMPLVMPDRIGVDTGAVYGNLLTALELPARRFHHA